MTIRKYLKGYPKVHSRLSWRYARMSLAHRMFLMCPPQHRLRLFDVLEAIRFLDIDHLEDVANDFPEFYI